MTKEETAAERRLRRCLVKPTGDIRTLQAWVIVDGNGNLYVREIFSSPEQAEFPCPGHLGFKVAPVTLTWEM